VTAGTCSAPSWDARGLNALCPLPKQLPSGEVSHIELHDSPEPTGRSAIVTFASPQALDTALLLTGSTIVPGEPPVTVTASYKPGESAPTGGNKKGDDDADLVDLKRVQEALASLVARGYVLGKAGIEKGAALDAQLGVSSTLIATAEDINARLRLTERGRELGSAASAGASALAAKAKELNEKHQIVQRGRGLVTSATTTVSETLEKAGPPGEAVKSAALFTRGLLARATAGAADLVTAARTKVDAISKEGALKSGESAEVPQMEELPQSTPAA
jgi:hypothetical protein